MMTAERPDGMTDEYVEAWADAMLQWFADEFAHTELRLDQRADRSNGGFLAALARRVVLHVLTDLYGCSVAKAGRFIGMTREGAYTAWRHHRAVHGMDPRFVKGLQRQELEECDAAMRCYAELVADDAKTGFWVEDDPAPDVSRVGQEEER